MQGGQSEQRTHSEGTKVGATRVGGVAGRKRGVGGLDEDEAKFRDSMLGETAESPPQERRNSAHTAQMFSTESTKVLKTT